MGNKDAAEKSPSSDFLVPAKSARISEFWDPPTAPSRALSCRNLRSTETGGGAGLDNEAMMLDREGIGPSAAKAARSVVLFCIVVVIDGNEAELRE